MHIYTITAALALAALGLATTAHAQRPSGDVLVVANKQDATASIIEVSSGRTLALLPTGQGPHEAAVSHDGRWAVVTDYGAQTPGSSLTIIDLDSLKVARRIDLAPHRRPHGVAFFPGDTMLAVTSEASQAVLMVDLRTGAVTALPTGQAGSHMLSLSADGARIYTANVGAGSVTKIDVATRQARTVPVAPRTEGITLSPDGRQVWVGSNEQHTVTVLDAMTLAPIDTLPAPGLPYRLNVGARGGLVVVSNPMMNTVRLFDVATRVEVAAIEIPQDPARAVPGTQGSMPVGGVVSPDGRTAYIALQGQNGVAVVDLESRTVTKYLETGTGPDGIALSTRYR
jgi:YVTN family beta-propeller protein